MKSKNFCSSIGMIIVLGLVGCGLNKKDGYVPKPTKEVKVASIPTGKESILLPLNVGNQWIFEVNSVIKTSQRTFSNKNEITLQVSKVEPIAGGKKATIILLSDNKVKEKQVWVVGHKGIYQESIGEKNATYTPAKIVMPFPLAKDKEFSWKGTGPSTQSSNARIELSGRILGPQEIDTHTGRLSAIATETTEKWNSNNMPAESVVTSWWAPGVGLARLRQLVTTKSSMMEQLLRLKSFSLK